MGRARTVSWRVPGRLPPKPTSFAERYAAGALNEFYALEPGDVKNALELPRPVDRSALAAALGAYADRLGAPRQAYDQLERLRHPDSRVVVTGQQAGLLLGPTYTLSKAVTALRLAAQLSTDAKPVVPVFWVASQDHDTAEVDHAYLLDSAENLHKLTVPLPKGVAAGRAPLQPVWLEALLADMAHIADNPAHLAEVSALLRGAATVSETFADLFAALLYRLLGAHGLVVINPLEPETAPLFKPLLAAELAQGVASATAVNEAGERVAAHGFSAQLGRGAGATNLFLEEMGSGTPQRQLLRFAADRFATDTAEYMPAEVVKIVAADPIRGTPAAGLRPISQDFALPTAVTVVGPGELRYFAQLGGVYELHQVAMPLIWPRATVTVLEPPVVRILKKFDLEAAELTQNFAELKAEKLLELHGHAHLFEDAAETLDTSLETMLTQLRAIDPTLLGTLSRSEERLRTTLDVLKTKTARALAREDDIYTRQFDRLEKHLLPLGTPQERLISPFSFFLKFGVQPVLAAFLAVPPEGDHTVTLLRGDVTW
ncbi:bacillithiol biosynthesis cysteine-adding enzyme BshC [soil metagenome]